MSSEKLNLKGKNIEELEQFFLSLGEREFRAKQMMKWIYLKGISNFESMTDFGKKLRAKLSDISYVSELEKLKHLISSDGETEKFLFRLQDGNCLETVLMSYAERIGPTRLTACISTQVGCPMGCAFCATGKNGVVRNLTAGEIVDQVIQMNRYATSEERRVANVVMMGMGEPFLNYDEVLKAIRILNHCDSIAIGSRHITISTCGIVPGIERLIREELQVKLAVSLHAPYDELRTKLMPVNRKYPLSELIAVLHKYQKQTGRRLTFEYALIRGLNDSIKDAERLAKLLNGFVALINLIPLNSVDGYNYNGTDPKNAEIFRRYMANSGFKTTVRKEMGADIDAACGQLRNRTIAAQQL